MKFCIDNGAHVNVINKKYETALHRAVETGNENAVRILLDAGADTKLQNHLGEDVYSLASEYKFKNILNLLNEVK